MYKSFHRYVAVAGMTLLGAEVLVLMASVYLGAYLRLLDPGLDPVPVAMLADLFPQASTFATVMVSSMAVTGMYQLEYREDLRQTALRLMRALLLGFGLIFLVFYWVPDTYFGRGILAIVMVLAMTGVFLTRTVYHKLSNPRLRKHRILVLGAGRLAKECGSMVEKNSGPDKYQVVGFIQMPNEVCQVTPAMVLPFHGSLRSMVSRHRIHEIVVAVRNRRSESFSIQDLLNCKLSGVRVSDTATFYERELGQVLIDSLQPSWMVFGDGFDQSQLRITIKRAFDLAASVLLLLFTLPVMLVAALCILIEDGSPILYRQERVGKDGHRFLVLKFRSMCSNAEAPGKPQWATENDPRTTRTGRVMRKLRIDELPQIINVLKGDMSFVGPRPERPYFVDQLAAKIPYYHVRHSIKPGITGWAQVRYTYGASVDDAVKKLQYDLYYVKNNSLFLDIMILIDTIRVVLSGKGGR